MENNLLEDIACVLERAAEEMFVTHTTDSKNTYLHRAMIFMHYEGDTELFQRVRETDVMAFLSTQTPFWRHNFRTVQRKVDCYLMAAAIARTLDED